jgi:6-phosphofructokinase 1
MTAIETSAVTLGYIQRGGTPSPYDRILATEFGYEALELLVSGVKDRLVVIKGGKLSSVPLSQVAGKIRTVPLNYSLIQAARAVNTCFGD